MQLEDMIGKTPKQMTDEELNLEIHRLRTSRVIEGKIVGQTKASRARNAAIKALTAIGLTEAQAITELDDREAKIKGAAANVDETTNESDNALGDDETIIP